MQNRPSLLRLFATTLAMTCLAACSTGGGASAPVPGAPAASTSQTLAQGAPAPAALTNAATLESASFVPFGLSPGGVYIAPAGTKPYPSGPFDQPVGAARVVGNSSVMIASVLSFGPYDLGKFQFSVATAGPTDGAVPIYVARNSDPHYKIHCMYYSGCPLEGAVVAIPKGARPSGNLGYHTFRDDGRNDQHMAVRNVDTGVETDMWLTPQPNDRGGILDIGYGGSYALNSGGIGRAGATAAGFSLSNGRIRVVDLLAGRIPYALLLQTPCENGHVPPAVGDDGGRNAGCPPIGAHVWLDSADATINNSGASPDFKVVMRALHQFGGYIGDRCTYCSLGISLEGGLSYTSFGLQNPWKQIAALHPTQIPSQGQYHIAVSTGNIDLRQHLHVIYP